MWALVNGGIFCVNSFTSISVVDGPGWSVALGNSVSGEVEKSEPLFFFETGKKEEVLKALAASIEAGVKCVDLMGFCLSWPEDWQDFAGPPPEVQAEKPTPAKPKVLDYMRLDLGECEPRSLGAFVGGKIAAIEVAGRVVAIKVEK